MFLVQIVKISTNKIDNNYDDHDKIIKYKN